MANNFVYFHPNKSAIIYNLKLDKTDEIDEILENSDFDLLSYDKQWKVYRIKLKEKIHKINYLSLFPSVFYK